MQTFKERVDKIPEGFAFSEDLVDDLLMVNRYRLKMFHTYGPYKNSGPYKPAPPLSFPGEEGD